MKHSLYILLCGMMIFAFGCDNSKQVGFRKGKVKTLETQADSMAYAIGQDIGDAYKRQGVDINAEALVNGLIASMESGQEPLLSAEAKGELVNEMMQEVRQKQMAQRQQTNTNSSAAVQIGKEAPNFTLQTPEGKDVSLADLRGDYVLIDFWASWCRPCRMENPNVVRVYNKYHEKGFEILGVSLDRTKDAWVKAIEKD
ncbi:MAG: redoxin domain-containing protein, partial [Bacteroidota bacterium]